MQSVLFKFALVIMILCSGAAQSKEKFTVKIKVPTSCENIQITEAYSGDDALLLVGRVTHPDKDVMCMTMITGREDSITLDITRPKHIIKAIVGKNWCWQNPSHKQGYTYIKSKAQLQKLMANKTRVFDKPLAKEANFKGFEADKHCKKDNIAGANDF